MMNLWPRIVILCTVLSAVAQAGPINATYDQRQNGKVNVHISIKDVAIILQSESALGGIGDDDINYDDYDYDYNHLTVKPTGIWAAGGGQSTQPIIGHPPPTPGIGSVTMPPGAAAAAVEATSASPMPSSPPESLNSNGSAPVIDSDAETLMPLIQYPMPLDFAAPMEPTHPELDLNGSSESPIINIMPQKPNRTTHKYAWNGNLEEIPVEVIIEPVLKNKQRQHVIPGAHPRPTRKHFRKEGKQTNKFGVHQLIKLLSALDKGGDTDEYVPKE